MTSRQATGRIGGALTFLILALSPQLPPAGSPEAAVSRSTSRQLQIGETNESGPVTSSSSSGRRQQASVGTAFNTGTLTNSRFQMHTGFFAAMVGTSTSVVPVTELDITVLHAKTQLFGDDILPATWQRDIDPVFLWDAPTSGTDLAGYSYAMDAAPDDTIDTSTLSWDVADTPGAALADGQHTFSVKALNSAGNSGKVASMELWVDTQPPTIGSQSPGPGTLVSALSQAITAAVSDAQSGISASTISLFINGTEVAVRVSGGTVTSSGGSLREGSNAIELRASDLVGNAATPLVWSVTADVTPPNGTILILGGADTSSSPYVTLNLSATDSTSGIAKVLLSNDPVIGYVEEPFSSVRELWRLTAVRGSQRVYAKFVDGAGNVSDPVMDEITLELLAPETLIVSGPAGITPQRDATFQFSSPEAGCVFSFAFDNADWSDWASETTVTRAGLVFGNHYFKVKAAKESNGLDGIQPDEEDPTPAERTWIGAAEPTRLLIPRGSPIKLWRLE